MVNENLGCQFILEDGSKCGAATFSKRINGKKMWKEGCPKHSDITVKTTSVSEAAETQVETQVETIEELEAKILALQAMIEEKKRIEAERIRLEELSKPIVISILEFTNQGYVKIKVSKIRDDVLAILKNTVGRHYDYVTETNTIPVSEYDLFKEEIIKLPNVEFKVVRESIEEEINKYNHEPDILVELEEKRWFDVTFARRLSYWLITSTVDKIPGTKLIEPTLKFKQYKAQVPLSEGWRLAQVLNEENYYIKSREVKSDALVIMEEQIENRSKLDNAAQLKDVENFPEIDLNGHTLRNFQKVGVRFAALALGLGDIAK